MQTNRGFTLIELMVVIAVLAIIATMAAPSFGNLVVRQKLNGNARDFIATLNQAKSQAALLRTTVAVCPNKTNSDDDFKKDECATAVIPNYSSMDDEQKKAVQINRVFQVQVDPAVTVQSTSSTAALFNPTGSANAQVSFNICASGNSRTITVQRLGAISQSSGTC
ncbi:prepilin-type N-terminal cleavage/methylation domain-containing protein [Acinetobacter sp. ANC 4910]|uniref:GspH/FimT family pseudopilin n=1 Tax=Acinetobacter sp. ANC 4910 TaxID=2529850 RepID=UPI00103EE31C|nr:GspH/FimT family pseudopilin [Acinetobacter sp. ANC 4910]TCB34624.1 prepilin-type N-terminal cleavage/methylation domain-containing protein [Acinetobacter sp. ANC 4910]